jgi:hypothetical protein
MAVRTPIAIATSLSFRTYPDAATRTPTAYGVTFA